MLLLLWVQAPEAARRADRGRRAHVLLDVMGAEAEDEDEHQSHASGEDDTEAETHVHAHDADVDVDADVDKGGDVAAAAADVAVVAGVCAGSVHAHHNAVGVDAAAGVAYTACHAWA